MKEYNQEKLYKYSIWLLSKRDYTKHELFMKMQSKSTSPTDIEGVLRKLDDLKYINETRYAQQLYDIYRKRYGWLKIKNKLMAKGFPSDIIDEIKIIDNNNDIDCCLHLVLKKFKTYDNNLDKEIWKYLMSKGFEQKKIKECLSKLTRNSTS